MGILSSQFALTFLSNSTGASLSHHAVFGYSCANWDVLCDHLKNVPRKDIFKLGDSAATTVKFCLWVQVGIEVYIPQCK